MAKLSQKKAEGQQIEQKKEKRVLSIELGDDVKKVSITGLGDDDKVVMMQELSEEDLDEATGGTSVQLPIALASLAHPPRCRTYSMK